MPTQTHMSVIPDLIHFQWKAQEHGGFSTTSPWMRVNDDIEECNAQHQLVDPGSVFHFWQRILHLRKQHKDIFVYGRFELVEHDNSSIICYQRISNHDVATMVLNFVDYGQEWSLPPVVRAAWRDGRAILTNYPAAERKVDQNLYLRPFEAVVMLESHTKHRL